jgi:hypothetical protein
MLAGGDVDGDLYLLLAPRTGLVPKRENIAKPASYEPPVMVKLENDCTITEGRGFFFDCEP